MTKKENRTGKIITFYSFKGGVGRTMTLANVAFLAAANGHRVLVMDWDLEAPGLSYYFRGLNNLGDLNTIKDKKGIMNLVIDWSNKIDNAKNEKDINDTFRYFSKDEPFFECVQDLIEKDTLPSEASLHIITAGSAKMDTSAYLTYEHALANFSWSEFFEYRGGGGFIERLRNWARNQYDYIFIDSRTGWADVAGICTMQLPDVVTLCFVLNRQNIDGISGVARAIKKSRNEDINIRIAPMRVSRENTSEEADARARALRELVKIGGMDTNEVEKDLTLLSIKAAQNIPFYEALAPFYVPDPQRDALTLDFARMATELCARDISIPSIESEWREKVQRRLAPKQATIAYILGLQSVEPTRAVDELNKFLENATNAIVDGHEIEADYAQALIDAAYLLFSSSALSEPDWNTIETIELAVNLLRVLEKTDPSRWRLLLADALFKLHENSLFFFEPDEEISDLEEANDLLSKEIETVEIISRRAAIRQKIAQKYGEMGDFQSQLGSTFETEFLLEKMRLFSNNDPRARIAEAEMLLTRGEARSNLEDKQSANNDYERALARLEKIADDPAIIAEIQRLSFELHLRLMQARRDARKIEDAIKHAIQATEVGSHTTPFIVRFVEIAEVVLSSKNPHTTAIKFIRRAFSANVKRRSAAYASFYGRTIRTSVEFLKVITNLLSVIADQHGIEGDISAMGLVLLELASSIVIALRRRYSVSAIRGVRGSQRDDLGRAVYDLKQAAKFLPNSDQYLDEIENVIRAFN